MSSQQPEITLYTTMFCPFCSRAKQLLNMKGATYNEIDVDVTPGGRQEMMQKSNGGYTVPQIFIGDTHVGGCDELFMLEGQGKLDGLLQSA